MHPGLFSHFCQSTDQKERPSPSLALTRTHTERASNSQICPLISQICHQMPTSLDYTRPPGSYNKTNILYTAALTLPSVTPLPSHTYPSSLSSSLHQARCDHSTMLGVCVCVYASDVVFVLLRITQSRGLNPLIPTDTGVIIYGAVLTQWPPNHRSHGNAFGTSHSPLTALAMPLLPLPEQMGHSGGFL